MKRAYYSDTFEQFCSRSDEEIIGSIVTGGGPGSSDTQQDAWLQQIRLLRPVLAEHEGAVHFEYAVPRMGTRIDVVLLIGTVIFVLEYKVGSEDYSRDALDQVSDYSLDLSYFHETSHGQWILPILIATEAAPSSMDIKETHHGDRLLEPIGISPAQLSDTIDAALSYAGSGRIDADEWASGRYAPTPTIIEAATSLYRGHSVDAITRTDAAAINLRETTDAINSCIEAARMGGHKAICFVTGVPGAGKTLVGLNIATRHMDQKDHTYSVFLSGNKPLVDVLREALARDKVAIEKDQGKRIAKKDARHMVGAFIQNVHHYRDEYLLDTSAPADHVALFDEAQRAWGLEQTAKFMKQKKNRPGFTMSEPEFLISCIDRHEDWGAIVCLVGGGQEIHTGEAGIGEWIDALNRSFPDWHVHLSTRLSGEELGVREAIQKLQGRPNVTYHDDLHLSVSMRSFLAEHVSRLVRHLLDLEVDQARTVLQQLSENYAIRLTRDLGAAKSWLRSQARGTERFGMVVSSQAERLKPHAIDVRSPMDPIHWFLDGKEDVRSSYYLEDVATEFSIQGLELDWVGVTWDADFRFKNDGWSHHSFRGSKWTQIRQEVRKAYQVNAYRVLLTRARQGMVITVPPGDSKDPTRLPEFYDETYEYLRGIGLSVL